MDIDDCNPKCFKVDYNNNQIEVSYGKDSSLFPVIIDDDVDNDGNVIAEYSTDNDDYNETDDELNRNRYLKRNYYGFNNNNNNNVVKQKSEEDEKDEMFEQLRRLSTAYDAISNSNNKQVRFSVSNNRKMSTIPFQPNITKELTFIINEIYFTNGKSSLELVQRTNKLQTKFFSRKKMFKKQVRCIGTSLKNCVQSDIISIDIDEKSTLLPMMCKLMIIVEGAVIERGSPVLVRDFALQVNLNSNGEEIVYDDKGCSANINTDDNTDEENEEDTYERKYISESKSQYCKLTRINKKYKKKIKKSDYTENISGRRDSYYRRQSYFNLNEYISVPYYQYSVIKKRINTDAESMTDDYYLTANNNIMIINSTGKEYSVDIPIQRERNVSKTDGIEEEDEEEIEISIPINIERNDDYDRLIRGNQGIYRFNGQRRRTVYEEHYNKFEAEVTRYNAANRFFKYYNNNPIVYTFFNTNNNDNNIDSGESINRNPYLKIEDSRSVTQVFLGHLVDGNLKN